MNNNIKTFIGKTFLSLADELEKKDFGKKINIGITLLGSELGIENVLAGAEYAAKSLGVTITLIGPKVKTELPLIEVENEQDSQNKLEELLDSKVLDGVVTMHYSFPIGVSTVGKVLTPTGKPMFIANTTGTTSTNRVEGMIKNAIYGNIVAKVSGLSNPTIGILNVDGAREVEKQLKKLKDKNYDLTFGESKRSDKGVVLRGNDLILGSTDVVVTDSLTGNILMKLFSSFTSGGTEEVLGYGYGPGVGFGYERKIFIISRASGPNVIKGAVEYAVDMVKGNLSKVMENENKKLKELNFDEILKSLKQEKASNLAPQKEVVKEVVTAQISGVDIMELDNAVNFLLSNNLYAEAGMGCTGPIVMVNENKEELARTLLKKMGCIE
ncbi:MAG: glycine/sarcosine/betaine reductase complex component C subunit alpha [Fusobacteriaceae bacterium]